MGTCNGGFFSRTGNDKLIYQIADHLGSIRVIKDGEGTVLQRFDYYPSGSESRVWTAGTSTPQSALRYRFGGKEIAGQKASASAFAGIPAAAAGSPYLDFGARLYDPRTAAWLSQDPMAEKYYPISPYVYCAGNPVNLVDPDGRYFYYLNLDGTLRREGEQSDYDMLFATDSKGAAIPGLSLKINNTEILSDLYQNGRQQGNVSSRTSSHEVADIFVFLANNSSSEWGLAGINNEGKMSFILMTSHDSNSIKTREMMSTKDERNMVFHIHSHPNPGEGSDRASGDSGDRQFVSILKNGYSGYKNNQPYFYIYSVARQELIHYSETKSRIMARSVRNVHSPLNGIMKIR